MDRTAQGEANKQKDNLKPGNETDSRSTKWGNKDDPNFDPSRQNSGIDAGKPSNPNTPTPRNMDQSEKELHPVVMTDDRLKASAKDPSGNPNEPIVTLNPTSSPVDSQGKSKTEKVNNALDLVFDDAISSSSKYNDLDIKTGEGYLLPVVPGKTIDEIVLEARREVKRLNDYWSVPATNEEGERYLDCVILEEFKRNPDKTVQIDGRGKPVVGANQENIPMRVQIRQYVAKPVTRSDKISQDGCLIVRVF